jgi:hypothetical protein
MFFLWVLGSTGQYRPEKNFFCRPGQLRYVSGYLRTPRYYSPSSGYVGNSGPPTLLASRFAVLSRSWFTTLLASVVQYFRVTDSGSSVGVYLIGTFRSSGRLHTTASASRRL